MMFPLTVAVALFLSLFVGGFMPFPGADVYGRGAFATQMIFGARSLGLGIFCAMVAFPLVYGLAFRKSLRLPWGRLVGLYLISASITGPMIRYALAYMQEPALILVPMILVPLVVLGAVQSSSHRND